MVPFVVRLVVHPRIIRQTAARGKRIYFSSDASSGAMARDGR